MSFKQFITESDQFDLDTAVQALKPFLDSKRFERFEAAVKVIADGLHNKSVFNPRFEEAKSSINTAIYHGVDKFVDSRYDRKLFYIDTLVSGTNNLNSAFKETTKKNITEYSEFLKKLLPLSDALKAIKPYIVKRQPKAPEGSVISQGFSASFSVDSAKLIYNKLKEVTSDIRQRQIEAFVNHYTKQADDSYNKMISSTPQQKHDFVRQLYRDAIRRETFYLLYDMDYKNENITKKPDGQAAMLKWCTREVDSILESYINKNTKKLAAIVEKKGNTKSIDILSYRTTSLGFESEIKFSFEDGAKFVVTNKVVYVWNSYGTNFVRFPTTFHDVYNSDGSKLSMPSEEKMSTKFF